MKLKNIIIFILFVVGVIFSYNYFTISPEQTNTETIFTGETIKVANWNLQIFGDAKASNDDLMNKYVEIINDYDIIFVQEIRDIDGSSFDQLCNMHQLNDYQCQISNRYGRSFSKEAQGVIFRDGINILEFKQFDQEVETRFERPPIAVTFENNGYIFQVWNAHLKPDSVVTELDAFETIVEEMF